MCGRYTVISDETRLSRLYAAVMRVRLHKRYNVAPSQPVPVVVHPKNGEREVTLKRWGLVPSWAKDIAIGSRMINARSETAAEKPAFRAAMKYRRCLVPADGFYEWKTTGPATRGPRGGTRNPPKQPYYIQTADEEPFAMAGLHEHWQDADGNELETCTVLTTHANEMMADIHERMPVILPPETWDDWLNPDADKPEDVERLQPLLAPYPAELMMARPVSRHVNRPANDDPRCIEPLPEQGEMFG